MSRIYCTFGGAAYDNTIEQIFTGWYPTDPAPRIIVYDDRWLMKQPFYELNKSWWSKPDTKYNLPNRGFGWFIWKPFIIMDALNHFCKDGDIVLYTDADSYPISDLSPLYEETARNGGVMLFEACGCAHEQWCKRDTFIVMAQDEYRYRHVNHACARFMLFRKGAWLGQQLLIEWMAYCLNPLANTFDESRIDSEYIHLLEPRCEQAILTNLAHKYGLHLYREACQAGNYALALGVDAHLYGQLFVQDGNCGDKNDLSGSKYRNVG